TTPHELPEHQTFAYTGFGIPYNSSRFSAAGFFHHANYFYSNCSQKMQTPPECNSCVFFERKKDASPSSHGRFNPVGMRFDARHGIPATHFMSGSHLCA